MHKNKSGFTIVELLIVIVIIGILAAITIVAYNGLQERSRNARRMSDLDRISKSIELYYVDNGSYPAGGCLSSWACWSTLMTTLSLPAMQDPALYDDNACGHPNNFRSRMYWYSQQSGGAGYILGAYVPGLANTDSHYAPNPGTYGCGNFMNYLHVNK